MMTLAIAAHAHHTEVKAYRLIASITRRIPRFAAPNITIILIFERKSESEPNETLGELVDGKQPG